MRLVLALVFALLAGSAAGQDTKPERRPGIAVDARGGEVIDPTKNVLDLVLAAVKRIDDLSSALVKRQDDLRDAETKFQNEMRAAETRRINELASQKQLFDLELARVLRANVDSAALLLSTQLKEVKTDLSDRVAKLEQFRWESGGRQTYQDPIMSDLLREVKSLRQVAADQVGIGTGRGDVIAWFALGITLLMMLLGGVGVLVTISRRPAAAKD